MAKKVFISLTKLSSGDSAFSALIDAEASTQYEFRITSNSVDPSRASQIRVGVSDQITPSPREVASKFIDGSTSAILVVLNPPARFQIEATCLIGQCFVVVESAIEESGLLVASGTGTVETLLPPTTGSEYLGTDDFGDFGYHGLPKGNTGHTHVYDEVPQGTINGSNRVFTLVAAPNPVNSLALHLNGILMRQGVGNDYLLTGGTISYSTSQVPTVGSTHTASYEIP